MSYGCYKKCLVIVILFLSIGFCIVPSSGIFLVNKPSTIDSNGTTLYVGGTGEGNYTKIQDAIDDANDGDIVFVFDDTSPYYENVEVNKSINLIGENRHTTEIHGEWYSVVYISADWVNISGFTIESENVEEFCGIKLDSCNNNISYNILADNWCGINLLDTSSNNTITDNIINGNLYLYGIWLSNSNNDNIIKNNSFSHLWSALYLSDSSNNTITDNYVMDNDHGILLDDYCMNNTIARNILINITCCTCIGLRHSDSNLIVDNIINYNSNWGNSFWIYDSEYNIVKGNLISYCGGGIVLANSSNNIVLCNKIVNCAKYGVYSCNYPLMCSKELGIQLKYFRSNSIPNNYYGIHHFLPSDNNTIYHNNFVNNNQNAYDECSNEWDNGYPSGGNYWDDYNGTDSDGDGIGDTPYPIPGGDNEDRYPLMEPWGNWTFSPFAKFDWAPSHPEPNDITLFNASASYDPDGYITLYEWDWDNDGIFDENHTSPTTTHTFEEIGFYPVTLRITDNENLTDSNTKTVRIGNQPPCPPNITGPSAGKTREVLDIIFNSVDPDRDQVIYNIDWGDSNAEETGFNPSGQDVTVQHTWITKGTYTIKAKAKDSYGAESDWTLFEVTISKSKSVNFNLLIIKILEGFSILQKFQFLLK